MLTTWVIKCLSISNNPSLIFTFKMFKAGSFESNDDIQNMVYDKYVH